MGPGGGGLKVVSKKNMEEVEKGKGNGNGIRRKRRTN